MDEAHAYPSQAPQERTVAANLTIHSIASHMVAIPAGSIAIIDAASRRHRVERIKPYLISKYVVTHDDYAMLMGGDAIPLAGGTTLTAGGTKPATVGNTPPAEGAIPSAGGTKPAVNVSWFDAIEFCNVLSAKSGLHPCYKRDADGAVTCDWDANGYRLPSEAEWEFACRAGSNAPTYGALDEIAWYRGNSGARLHPVGLKQPNDWGLYDTLGNVWEWCWDVFDEEVYGPYRVFRGGGWSDPAHSCRASVRRKSHPTFRIDDFGFRVARSGATRI